MNEKILNELLLSLSGKVSNDDLLIFKKELVKIFKDYEVTKRKNELVVYQNYPSEVKTYLAVRVTEGVSKATVKNYELVLRQFFMLTKMTMKDVTANDIRLFLYNYQEAYGVSNRTLEHMRNVIATFFAWCNAEGYVDRNPALVVKPIKYAKTII